MSKKMRILMISVRADFGGGPEHIYRLVSNLPDGVEIHIACPRDIPYWERFSSVVGEANLLQIPHRRFTLRHLWEIVKYVRKNNIEIIHSHGKGAGIYGRLAALLARKICIHTYHGIHTAGYGHWQKRLYILLERFLSIYTDRLIAVSDGEAKIIEGLRLCSRDKLCIIKNGVVCSAEKRNPPWITTSERLKIYLVSRFDYAKNSELIIPILQHLQEMGGLSRFAFNFLGDGEGRIKLEKRLAELGLESNVTFHGNVSEISDYFKDAFCLLSTSRWEGMPLSVLEAMAWGIPVIATNVVGNQDVVIHGQSGFLYDISRPVWAAEYLLKLAGSRELWESFSRKSADLVRREYSVGRMAADTYGTYAGLIRD